MDTIFLQADNARTVLVTASANRFHAEEHHTATYFAKQLLLSRERLKKVAQAMKQGRGRNDHKVNIVFIAHNHYELLIYYSYILQLLKASANETLFQ